jgi:hypothetical protein
MNRRLDFKHITCLKELITTNIVDVANKVIKTHVVRDSALS